jgi:hypothetical protein
MAYTQLIPRHTPDARVEEIARESSHYLLSIPSGSSDSYRLAQLDDYTKISRKRFPHREPVRLSLLARTSSTSIPGTWGFGLWNDPFGLSLGFGGNPWRLPTLPNTAWFFGASEENYLSFASGLDTGETLRLRRQRTAAPLTTVPMPFGSASARPTRPPVFNGFIAQTFRAPKFHPLLILAGLALPFSRKTTRRLLGQVIEEDGIQLSSGDRPVDHTDWHRYSLDWRETQVSFEVDNALVLESSVSPNPPLGLVIWIDNQYAAFTPEGRIGFGVLANPEPAWLEVKDVELIAR